MADIAYPLTVSIDQEVYPCDPETGQDIEDLGLGVIVEVWVPNSRREDVDRNDANRRQLTGIIEAAIVAAESDG